MASYVTVVWISRSTPISWITAVAGIWLLPVSALIVVTAAAIAGTAAIAVRAVHDDCIDKLAAALLRTRPAPVIPARATDALRGRHRAAA